MAMRYFQLRAFDAVAREGSFTRAASLLGLTQPAITTQIRNLEEDCKQALFVRTNEGVHLTEAARPLFDLTRQMFSTEEQIEDMVSQATMFRHGSLKLAADGPQVVLQVVAAFRKHYPEIEISISFGSQREVWDDLIEYRVDAAVIGNAKSDPRVASIPIAQQDMRALVPKGHALARCASVSLADLAAFPVIRREAGSNTQRMVDEAARRAKAQLVTAMQLGSREAVIEAVRQGLGIGFVLEREVPESKRTIAIPVDELRGCNIDSVVCLHSQRKRGIVQTFLGVAALAASLQEPAINADGQDSAGAAPRQRKTSAPPRGRRTE
ncbi:aminoethylphosphonate catabolism LysR family transcriptional regulator [Paraburkholderia bannensis]|uniref:Aminoethylphosphonate catabolism LysR family transcriptional regulator n=1 Tax=Paraburkholderia bannensis TaxID=765414 RepID=A0A7W9U190_9BURK|nr:aminoethylphosphonate catabolism LysR family transcriptional regulator [Paraburkholderia sp. WP4_3_2]MBB6104060.1 aminoethylphosphonate catabolism LysR family transcriptional regulator [Paraburkholderia bannensis]